MPSAASSAARRTPRTGIGPGLCHGTTGVCQTAARAARDARTPAIAGHLPELAARLEEHAADVAETGLLTGTAPGLDHMEGKGAIAGGKPAIYEPETTAFGGPGGRDAAHALICADTHGIFCYLRHEHPPAGRRELSVLLISTMLAAAGLDWFERGDVFARVAVG